ncbi:MAG: oxygen-independent coproporphyrinogen III oxidase [Rhizobiaceae bacterium]
MFDPELILEHYQKPVPRYTSYPTAPQFKPNTGAEFFDAAILDLPEDAPVSAYIHIPYCDRLCWFCGCHTKHTLKYAPVSRYVQSLIREIALLDQRLAFRPRLGQLHLGGGSPSLLNGNDLKAIREALAKTFDIDNQTEISVEIDPSDVNDGSINRLVEFGLTRASIGVQDFHEDVQAAINRPQSYEVTADVVDQLRAAGVRSVNIDALYGLPLQTLPRLLKTIDQCISLQPDRIALFGYAHVPWLKKHQKLICENDLAGPLDRYQHAQEAAILLRRSGYESIGIDHFAMPKDSLAKASRNGRLRRNFQGYTTDHHETLLGMGASSIGRFAQGYVQNTVATHQYQAEVTAGILPKGKGLQLTDDDKLRGYLIERLMCDFAIDFDTLSGHPDHLVEVCVRQARNAAAMDRFGLCTMNGSRFEIAPQAKAFTRIVAAIFDAYYQTEKFQYSKAV